MVITIRKVQPADDSANLSASDMRHQPAQYGVFSNNEQVGVIMARSVRAYETAVWRVYRLGPNLPGLMKRIPGDAAKRSFYTYREAKAWALTHDWPQPLAKTFRYPADQPWSDTETQSFFDRRFEDRLVLWSERQARGY